jgi:hypothetical protein
MPNDFDIIYDFKFAPSNYVHEKARTIDSYVFVDIHFVFATCRKNEFSSATKTRCWDCSGPNALGLFVSLL